MKRFHTPDIHAGKAVLTGSEKDHCVRVLRTRKGETIEIADGLGCIWAGIVGHISKDAVEVDVGDAPVHNALNPAYPLPEIAVAIPKNQARWDTMLEKTAEIGVSRIVPILARRSEKSRIREERSRQILVAAFKQSRQLFLPKLHDVMTVQDYLGQIDDREAGSYMAHCTADGSNYLGSVHAPGVKARILIGPEGDFIPEEISLARAQGFREISLGPNILRVETAAIAACTIIQCIEMKER